MLTAKCGSLSTLAIRVLKPREPLRKSLRPGVRVRSRYAIETFRLRFFFEKVTESEYARDTGIET